MSIRLYGALAAGRVLVERVRENKKACAYLRMAGWALLAVLALTAWSLVMVRVGQKQAMLTYQEEMEDYRLQMVNRAAIDAAEAMEDPYQLQLNAEADMLAKVLYGVKDNSDEDLITYCWCVFNRVDNAAFPGTLEDVIEQPQQWMRYSADNPVLDSLYALAREQLDLWHSGSHRPVSNEYVYMNWSPSRIKLRDRWDDGSNTEYWRWGA